MKCNASGRKVVVGAVAISSLLCMTRLTRAAVIDDWTVAGGGSWNVGGNWSTGIPDDTKAATFNAALPAATNVITLDGDQTTHGVNVVTGSGTKIVNITAGTPSTSKLILTSTDSTTDGSTTFQALSSNSGIMTVAAPIQLGNGSSGSFTATFNATTNTTNSLVITGGVTESPGQIWGVRVTGSGTSNAIVSASTTTWTHSGDTTVAAGGILRLLTAEMLPNGVGKGNVVIEGNGILRGQGNPGGFGSETINGLNSTSATAQVNLNQNNTRTLSVGDANASGNYPGQIVESTGTFAFTKIGSGTQVLGGTSNGSGVYTVTGGTLIQNGVHTPRQANANGYSVASGATLGGTGTVAQSGAGASTGTVTVNGTVAPGDSTSAFTTGSLDVSRNITFNNNSTFAIELAGNQPGDGGSFYDQLNMTLPTGTVTLAGTDNLAAALAYAYAPDPGDVFYILTRADAGSFGATSFAGAPEGGTVNLGGGYAGQITYQANWTGTQAGSALTGGNDVALYNIQVPEPATIGLLTMAGVVALSRRRRSA